LEVAAGDILQIWTRISLESETLGTIGCDCIYYDSRTGKKYVGVHCLIGIKEIQEFLDAI
jgi:hypothetical protein